MAIKIGLVGTGTVGGGCLEILNNHKEDFKKHLGVDLELVRVCSREPERAEEFGVSDIFTLDYTDVVNDPEVDIVIELIGGTTIAKKVVCEALAAGKNVVTANKALIASCGAEIFALAAEQGKEIAYEASVGGGIPIIDPLKHSLIANEISSVIGIVNGTTNYMLTRMDKDKMGYDEALKEAQAAGFAEANPSADVDGFDAAAKIAILSTIAFNERVTLDDVHTEGIRNITPLDFEAAHDMGYSIKLLAIAHRTDKGIDVRVHPTMIPLSHQLSAVNGVFNAIYVVGDAVGETMFFGEGAGSGPAASAVMGDVLEVARHIANGVAPTNVVMDADPAKLIDIEDIETKYYIRFSVADQPGVLAAMATVFANHEVSVRSVIQRGKQAGGSVEVVYVTHTASERAIRAVLADIAALDGILDGEPSLIRVEDNNR